MDKENPITDRAIMNKHKKSNMSEQVHRKTLEAKCEAEHEPKHVTEVEYVLKAKQENSPVIMDITNWQKNNKDLLIIPPKH